MSKSFESCVMCHDEPPADRFGWCDTCARLYDQPNEPTEADREAMNADFARLKLNSLLLAELFGDYTAIRSAQ